MNSTQDEAISLIFIGRITKREVYNAFTGQEYAHRKDCDPAHITPENFDILVGVTRRVQKEYLEDQVRYKPELERMFAAYDQYDLESFKAAADSLLAKIVEE